MAERSASIEAKSASSSARGLLLQRKCACGTHTPDGGECEECAGKRLQRKSTAHAGAPGIPPLVHDVLGRAGAPLPAPLARGMGRHFGHDFSGVRIHHDSLADSSARAVHAHAYTVGSHVVFADGQFAPQTSSGQRLLAHELAHVVQQRRLSALPSGIGEAGSALEREADRAADQVMTGGAPTLGTAPQALLLRQSADEPGVQRGQCHGTDLSPHITQLPGDLPRAAATVSRVESVSANEKRVVLSSGQRYLVTRTPWTRSGDGTAPRVSASADADRDQVWVDVQWCTGASDGSIRVAANVPEQATQLLLNAIRSGGDVSAAWAQASITPSVTGEFHSGRWSFEAGAQTTVGSGGDVQDVQGHAQVSRDVPGGRVTGGVAAGSQQVGGDPLGGVQGNVFVRFEWGAEPHRTPACDRHWSRSGFTYGCVEERDTPPRSAPGVQDVSREQEHRYNLFFNYAVADFDDARNGDALAGLATDLQAGYQVAGIDAWASPEGPMEPTRRFMGNQALSEARAEAARRRIAAMCGAAPCFAGGMQAQGHGERMDPTDAAGAPRDVAGAALESHVTQTFPTDPGEASVRSPELMDRLRRTRSQHQRAEEIYPTLRRAVIRLSRSQTTQEACTYDIPAGTETRGIGPCPPLIRRSAFPDDSSSP